MSEEELNETIQYNLDYTEAVLSDELFGGNEVAEVKLLASEKAIKDLQQKAEQLENIRKEAIEWCKCVINSKTTAGELPNGKHTDMGYCLDLAEPLLKILEEGDNKE